MPPPDFPLGCLAIVTSLPALLPQGQPARICLCPRGHKQIPRPNCEYQGWKLDNRTAGNLTDGYDPH